MAFRQIEVAAGIIWREDRFLASKRPQGSPFADYWEFPGGKIEDGETAEAALIRELEEELGISVQACALTSRKRHEYAKENLSVELYFFTVTAFAGEPHPGEGQQLRWLTVREAQTLPFLPADQEILKSLTPPPKL